MRCKQPLPNRLWQFLGVKLYHASPMRRSFSASTSLEGPSKHSNKEVAGREDSSAVAAGTISAEG